MKKIPIQEAKKLAQDLDYDMIIIIGVNENLSGHVTTYGKTKHWCKVAGHVGQEILAPEVFGKDGKVLNTDWQELFSKGEDYNSKNNIKKFEETEEGREEFNPTPSPKSEETAPCMQCGKDTGIVPEMCCSGSATMECGCMGQPVNGPFFCSNECYDKYVNGI